ncbi:alkyl sulfatase C-terminal domain-containing protein [Acetobacter tropicalis]|uniref:Alkyl sulfatase C-terminal domain-containing protein n=1 Tax=Acetobacter tropicalis TaxID=104102 RepID=A0A252AAR7_9PROT|nr:alkyl sulfatase C-terminal domain-containing protein [Acetobacter tropicalis]OUI86674.1 hypothetical protein HC62_03740 [Acetobacter tropicalis]
MRNWAGPTHHAPPFARLVNLPTDLFLDAASVRLVPDQARNVALRFTLVDPGAGENTIVDVSNAVLVHYTARTPASNAPMVWLDAKQFYKALTQPADS